MQKACNLRYGLSRTVFLWCGVKTFKLYNSIGNISGMTSEMIKSYFREGER